MAELCRTKSDQFNPSKCLKSKTRQVNIKMSDELKKACQDRANELGVSFTDFLAEGALHMLENHHTEKQRVAIMVQNQERINQAFSILNTLDSSPETDNLRYILFEILKGEESAWQL